MVSRTYWPSTRGGAEKYFYEVKKKINHPVTVYTWDKVKGKDIVQVEIPKVKIIGSMIFSLKTSCLIRKKEHDLIHVNQFWSEYLSFLTKKKLVSSIHDLPSKNDFLHRMIMIHSAKKSEAVFCLSEAVKKELISEGVNIKKLFYAPPGISITKVKLNKRKYSKGEKIFTHVSRIAPNKDLITIIRALKLLKKDYDFKFYVIGQKMSWTDYYKRIVQEIKANDLEDNVKILGKVDEKTKNELVRSSDAYLHASRYGEGFGMPIVEAQRMGIPVITSNLFEKLGTVKSNHTGLIFKAGDEKELKQKIKKLLSDSRLRRKLISNAKKISKTYDWNKTSKIIQEVYEKVYRGKL